MSRAILQIRIITNSCLMLLGLRWRVGSGEFMSGTRFMGSRLMLSRLPNGFFSEARAWMLEGAAG